MPGFPGAGAEQPAAPTMSREDRLLEAKQRKDRQKAKRLARKKNRK